MNIDLDAVDARLNEIARQIVDTIEGASFAQRSVLVLTNRAMELRHVSMQLAESSPVGSAVILRALIDLAILIRWIELRPGLHNRLWAAEGARVHLETFGHLRRSAVRRKKPRPAGSRRPRRYQTHPLSRPCPRGRPGGRRSRERVSSPVDLGQGEGDRQGHPRARRPGRRRGQEGVPGALQRGSRLLQRLDALGVAVTDADARGPSRPPPLGERRGRRVGLGEPAAGARVWRRARRDPPHRRQRAG